MTAEPDGVRQQPEEDDDERRQIQSENVDEVRKLVAEEGRSARNLLVWNVPVEPLIGMGTEGRHRAPLSPRSAGPKPSLTPRESEKPKSGAERKTRMRSASAERDPKRDLRARYWAFLFDNLRRAVDEIYTTCETNENISECKEVIMILENFTKEFSALIDWIKLKTDYENTPLPNRPHSLAWEVRKSSPIKMGILSAAKNFMNARVSRCLNFGEKTMNSVSAVEKSMQTEPCHEVVLSASKVASEAVHVATAPLVNPAVPKTGAKTLTGTPFRTIGAPKVMVPIVCVPKPSTRTACGPQGLPRSNQLTNKLRSGQVHSASNANATKAPGAKQPLAPRVGGLFTNHQNKPILSSYHASQAAVVAGNSTRTPAVKEPPSNEFHRAGSNTSLNSLSSSSSSWAERVKGHVECQRAEEPPAQEVEDDSEGWETVQRPRFRSRTSPPFKISKTVSRDENILSQQWGHNTQCNSAGNARQRLFSSGSGGLRRTAKSDSVQSLPSLNLKVPSSQNNVPERDFKPDSRPTARCKRSNSYPTIGSNDEHSVSGSGLDELKVHAASTDQKSRSVSFDGEEKREVCEASSCKTALAKLSQEKLSRCLSASPLSHIAEVNDAAVAQTADLRSGEKATQRQRAEDQTAELKDLTADAECNSSDDAEATRQLSPDFADSEGRSIDDASRSHLDDELESAIEQEKNLTKQIEETQKSGADLEAAGCHASSEPDLDAAAPEGAGIADWYMLHQETEELLGHNVSDMAWGDRMDQIDAEMRHPGRALHMHEKLSSPSRKRSLSESIRRHEEKQAKAQELRERLLEEKSQKLRELSKKVEEVRTWKDSLLNQRRNMMMNKLEKAEEKRRLQLQKIVRKAHDEEEKVNEIAFINTLEAQNKRHDVLTRFQGFEARLQDIQEERQRKQEEKAAKEAAVEERRRVLEAERRARLVEILEKRKQKEHKIEQQLQEKEKERQEQAREKARDREERLSALHAAQQATAEELQKKIQQKQEESARRHEENIEHKRQKALELSITRYSSTSDEAPRLIPYETKKFCTLCNVVIGSEVYLLSHLRGKRHQESVREEHEGVEPSREELEKYNLKHIIDAPADKLDPEVALDKERRKALKKRCKKLRHRMSARGAEYERLLKPPNVAESLFKTRIARCVKDVTKWCQALSTNSASGSSSTMERSLNEMSKILEKQNENDLTSFRCQSGFTALTTLLAKICEEIKEDSTSGLVSEKIFICACKVYALAFTNEQNCIYALGSNKLGELVDLLSINLNRERSVGPSSCLLPADPAAAAALLHVLSSALDRLPARAQPKPLHDVISYVVSVGIVDRLAVYFNGFRPSPTGVMDDDPLVCDFLVEGTRAVASLTRLLTDDRQGCESPPDPTQLLATLRVTGLAGAVSLLYAMLLPSGTPSRGDAAPPRLAPRPLAVATSCLLLLNRIAVLDLRMFQGVLGDEGLSLEFRHIAGHLLWYCSHHADDQELLHEVILLVGYFTVLSADNQMMIQSGHPPTVLQQLCALPFRYFSNPSLASVLFPTLVACCFANAHNKAVLEQDMSCQLIATFLQEETSRLPPEGSDDPSREGGRWRLRVRFPVAEWSDAALFFSSEN